MERIDMSDGEILAAVRSSDQLLQSRAVDVLLKQVRSSLIKYVKQNSGTHEEGVMMANEVVVVLWDALGRATYHQKEGVKLSTWCIRVGMNLWLKELRSRKVRAGDNHNRGERNEVVDATTPLDIITAVEEHKLVSSDMQRAWRAFKRLSAGCQQLFTADLEDKPEEFVMQELGMTNIGGVKVKRHRCKEKWIELYKQEPPVQNDGGTE